jgi:UDP-3-O-[3-hydroxymyristoyl] glucosamine N-acyltransferase
MENIITLKEIIKYFETQNHKIISSKIDTETTITGPRSITDASKNHISFLSIKYKESAGKLIIAVKASLVVVETSLYKAFDEATKEKITAYIVLSDTPKNTFVECLHHFFKEENKNEIHSSVVIHPSAKIGKNVSIGPFTVIDKNVVIGDDCVIGANTHIQKGSIIGNRVNIRSNVTIGNWGFGFVKDESGNNINFPHYGNAVIEDDVQIGSSTCVDRGALGDTIIKKGAKIDNLVHVAHNVIIGENALVIACTMIGGSTVIGDNCWVAPAVILRNGISIGENSTLGMGCLVTKDIPANVTVTGTPAIPLDEYKRLLKAQKKMTENFA